MSKEKTMFNEEQAVVPKGKAELAHADQFAELGFSLDENMEGTTPRLPLIEIIHRGQMFNLPDDEKKSKVSGVIVDSSRVNAYWIGSFSEGGAGQMPDCFSYDGIRPDQSVEEPKHTLCAQCPMNQFGSDGKRGKACKNARRVHVLMDGNAIPYRLTLPPSSLRSWDDYMVTLTNKKRPYPTVITEIGLKKAENKDKIEYSETVFKMIEEINDSEQLMEIRKLRNMMAKQMQTESIVSEEIGTNGAPVTGDPFQ